MDVRGVRETLFEDGKLFTSNAHVHTDLCCSLDGRRVYSHNLHTRVLSCPFAHCDNLQGEGGGFFFVWCWQSVQECGTREDGRRQTGEKHLVVKYGHKGRCRQITEGGVPEANTKAFKNSHCAHEGRTGKLRGAFDFICQPFLLECFFLKVGVTRITKERTPGFVPTLE